jgi:hypothetical protein
MTPHTNMMHMKTLFGSLWVLAAIAVALVLPSGAHAQIVTFNTIVSANGNQTNGFTGGNTALSETFTNVAELNNLTYQFVEIGNDSVDQTVNAYLVQWNTSTNSIDSTITLETSPNSTANESTTALSNSPLLSFTVPAITSGSWTTQNYSGGGTYSGFQQVLNINQILDPSLTYAIVLIDTTNASGLGLPGIATSTYVVGTGYVATNSFNGYGGGYTDSYVSGGSITSLEGGVPNQAITGAPDDVYGFSQIQLVPGNNTVPTPEPRTAAAILCALFVAALVGRQLILRRRESEDGITALAA